MKQKVPIPDIFSSSNATLRRWGLDCDLVPKIFSRRNLSSSSYIIKYFPTKCRAEKNILLPFSLTDCLMIILWHSYAIYSFLSPSNMHRWPYPWKRKCFLSKWNLWSNCLVAIIVEVLNKQRTKITSWRSASPADKQCSTFKVIAFCFLFLIRPAHLLKS